MEIVTAAINKSLFDYAEATCQSFLIRLGSSCCVKTPTARSVWSGGVYTDDLVSRRWVKNTEEDVSERVRGGLGRHGGQLDSVSPCWRIHTIRGTSHARDARRHNQTPASDELIQEKCLMLYLLSALIPSSGCV